MIYKMKCFPFPFNLRLAGGMGVSELILLYGFDILATRHCIYDTENDAKCCKFNAVPSDDIEVEWWYRSVFSQVYVTLNCKNPHQVCFNHDIETYR